MELLKRGPKPSTRLKKGNVVLANAQTIDTTPVKQRLDAFFAVHSRYIERHAKVEQAEAEVSAELARVQRIVGDQNKALTALSLALQADGESPRNAFGRFAAHAPGEMMALPFEEEVRAIFALVSTLHDSLGLSPQTLEAADKAALAAKQVEQVLPGLELRRTYLAQARQERDALARQWHTAYSALRYFTKSQVEVRDLYETLFTPPRQTAAKPRSEPEVKDPPTPTPPEPPPVAVPAAT